MGNWSDDASSCRVIFFKPSGKYAYEEAVNWTGPYRESDDEPDGWDMHSAFAKSLRDHLRQKPKKSAPDEDEGSVWYRLRGLIAVCIDPYHEHSYPIVMSVEKAIRYDEFKAESKARMGMSEQERERTQPEFDQRWCAFRDHSETDYERNVRSSTQALKDLPAEPVVETEGDGPDRSLSSRLKRRTIPVRGDHGWYEAELDENDKFVDPDAAIDYAANCVDDRRRR